MNIQATNESEWDVKIQNDKKAPLKKLAHLTQDQYFKASEVLLKFKRAESEVQNLNILWMNHYFDSDLVSESLEPQP